MRTWSMLLLVLVLAATPVLAVDYWQGPPQGTWNRGDAGTTFEHWDFNNPNIPLIPDGWSNPYGEPWGEFVPGPWTWGSDWPCPPSVNPSGFVTGWHCSYPGGGAVTLTIPNDSRPSANKYIFVQVTSTQSPTGVTVSASGPGPYSYGTWPTGLPQIQHGGPAPFGGSWYTYTYGLKVQPNPASETITITVPFCCVIDQVVVDTICTDVPVMAEVQTWGSIKSLFQ